MRDCDTDEGHRSIYCDKVAFPSTIAEGCSVFVELGALEGLKLDKEGIRSVGGPEQSVDGLEFVLDAIKDTKKKK